MAKKSKAAPILEARMRLVSELVPHPRNYKAHPDDQLDHIAESLREHGVYKNVVLAQDGTILAGHGVVAAARREGLEEILAIQLPIASDSPAALKIVVGDNEIGRLAENDDRVLTDLLKDVQEAGSLLGTGFDSSMLAGLLFTTRTEVELESLGGAGEWAGLPSYDEEGKKLLRVVMSFTSEEDRDAFVKKIGATDATHCTKGPVWTFRWPLRSTTDDWESVRFEGEATQ